jgi:hypothetical protein
VLDSQAYGRMYVAPIELRSFEADSGTTNKINIRLETHALYTASGPRRRGGSRDGVEAMLRGCHSPAERRLAESLGSDGVIV